MTSTSKTSTKSKKAEGFSDFEREAMKERYQELKADKSEGEKLLLAKISQMKGLDRTLAQRIYEIIKKNAPTLNPKTWYGMPAYANKDGKVVCFFQSAEKFKYRYATLGFNDPANLDEGNMWPTSFALKNLSATDEAKIIALVKKAVG